MICPQWDKRSLGDIGSKIFLDLYGTSWGADLNTVATMMVTAQFMEMRVLFFPPIGSDSGSNAEDIVHLSILPLCVW